MIQDVCLGGELDTLSLNPSMNDSGMVGSKGSNSLGDE